MILESVGIARKCGQKILVFLLILANAIIYNDKNYYLHANNIVLEFSSIIYSTYARRAFQCINLII